MTASFNQLFQVDSVWQYPPFDYQEMPIPVLGYNLNGEPIRQGYPEIVFVWDFMDQEDLTRLLSVYDPENPQVNLQYIDKATGVLVERSGMMHEPVIAKRGTVFYFNVGLKFTRIDDPL